VIEELDLKLVPSVLDDKIADAIDGAVAQHRDKLGWNFARTLSKRLPLSARIAPPKLFEIRAVGGAVSVTEDELRFSVRFEACIETRAAVAEAARPSAREARRERGERGPASARPLRARPATR
jgi:hypothetical protein